MTNIDRFLTILRAGDYPGIVKLLDDMPNLVHDKNDRGMTLLHLTAAEIGDHADIVHLLIARGADPNDRDNTDWTPADWADLMLNQDVLLLLGKPG